MSKVIAVFGATGNQGGSVLQALLKTGNYHIKAITRNAQSDKAKSLASLENVTVTEGNLDDEESVDRVLKDCYGAFLATDFSAHLVRNRETQQGVNVIDKAIKNKVSHVVFSGLENVESIMNKSCYHFDEKAAVEDYGLKQKDKINFTSIRLPMYYQAIVSMINKASDNQFLFNLPMDSDKKLYSMNVNDIGPCVSTIFSNPEQYKSKLLGVAGDHLKVSEVTDLLSKHLAPINISFPGGASNRSRFEHLKFPGVEDIVTMFEYFETEKMKRDLELTKTLNPNVVNFNDWLVENREKIIANKLK